MTKSKTWPALFLILALMFVGLAVGTVIGGRFFVPEGSGLAGPAIALSYGMLGAFIALVLGVFVMRVSSRRLIVQITLALVLVIIGFIAWRVLVGLRRAEEAVPPTPVPTQPVEPVRLWAKIAGAVQEDPAMGMGMVRPASSPGVTFYFYNRPDFDQLPDMVVPLDSLVFGLGSNSSVITYAPPWFAPEVLKLDYDLLFLRAMTVSRYWIEVVVNASPDRPRLFPETAWVAREAVEYLPWPDFLLTIHSVEASDPAANPVRAGPFENAPVVADAADSLYPIAVKGDWLMVATGDHREPPYGWLRWRADGRLLVRYNLLS